MTPTASRTTPLVTKLNSDWDAFSIRTLQFGPLGFCEPSTLLTGIRSTSGSAAQDEVLYTLLCLARDGHTAAERVLLQALIPAARRMAHRVRSLDDFDRADRVGYAIGAAWESIRTYRLHLHARVMANLTMNMLRILTPEPTANDRLIASRTTPVSDDFLEEVSGAWSPEPSPETELANLFTWAIDTNVLTRDEVALLSRVALGDETHEMIAADLGMARDGLRTKVKRIRKRLSTAVQYQLVDA